MEQIPLHPAALELSTDRSGRAKRTTSAPGQKPTLPALHTPSARPHPLLYYLGCAFVLLRSLSVSSKQKQCQTKQGKDVDEPPALRCPTALSDSSCSLFDFQSTSIAFLRCFPGDTGLLNTPSEIIVSLCSLSKRFLFLRLAVPPAFRNRSAALPTPGSGASQRVLTPPSPRNIVRHERRYELQMSRFRLSDLDCVISLGHPKLGKLTFNAPHLPSIRPQRLSLTGIT